MAAVLLLLLEAVVVIFLALQFTARWGLLLAGMLAAVLTAGVAIATTMREPVRCNCFGVSTVVLTRRHILRNAVLALAAGWAALAYRSMSGMDAVASVAIGLVLALPVVLMDDLVPSSHKIKREIHH